MHTTRRQPSQGSTDCLSFRIPPQEADALRRLADARSLPLGRMLLEHVSPLVALAVDLA